MSEQSAEGSERLIPLYSPHNELELSLLRSRLEAEQIPYQVTNDHFGSLYIGVQIESFNRRNILIPENCRSQAETVLEDFLLRQRQNTRSLPEKVPFSSWRDKLRALLEVVLLGWIVPRPQPAERKITMSFELSFNAEQGFFHVTSQGKLSAPGMADIGEALLTHDKWHPGTAVLFDHRQLEFSATPVEVLEEIREFHRSHQDQIGYGKSAFVVSPGQIEAWLKLWQQGHKISSDHRTAVFDKMDEALNWLYQTD